MDDRRIAIEMENISKQFPGVVANDRVDFTAFRGCIHAIVGENGAGKTTLMNILNGLVRADSGSIRVNGNPVSFGGAKDAIAHGIGMIHQHFMLVPSYTVAENIILGEEPRRRMFVDMKAARAKVEEISTRYGLAVDPDARIGDLPIGVRQRAEILKQLYRGLDILVFDEPTAVLTPQETSALLATMRTLAEDGRTIVFITHKLPEVLEASDYVTVLRRGRVAANEQTKNVTADNLARLMVGRDLPPGLPKTPAKPKEIVLRLKDVVALDNRGLPALKGVSLRVRSGEIVTIAGVQGNGQTELAEVVSGLRSVVSGEVHMCGKEITGLSSRQRRELGLCTVPEDRIKTGLAIEATTEENLIMGKHYKEPLSRWGRFDFRAVKAHVSELVHDYDIRVPDGSALAQTLSGGNLQKTVVAREFSQSARVYVVSQPTRGVDIGSTEFIHRRILQVRDEGAGVLLVSTDLDEVFALSDRILVVYDGDITGAFRPGEANRKDIGAYMMGTRRMAVSCQEAAS